MSAQVAADLRAAADVLRRDGWTQETYHDSAGCHCAVGAIEVATGIWENGSYSHKPGMRTSDAWRALMSHLGHENPEAVFTFNDAETRTADEVIAALEAAAQAAELQAQPQSGDRP